MIAVYKYQVNFNPEPSPPSPPVWLEPIEPTPPFGANGLPVTAPLALFTFVLSDDAIGMGAKFLTYPLQWFTDTPTPLTPNNPPPDFEVQWYSNTYFAVWDYNSTQTTTSHNFHIIVFHEGNLYSGDPVIINEPPMPTG